MSMKIISVNITEFGGLSDFSLDFSDGLNIIEGANESGKSTVLLFVMYMLYGLPKSTRRGTPGEFDKDRSLSRRSGSARGSMIVECDGVKYRIERSNLKRGKNSEVKIEERDTGARAFEGEEPGVALLGVSRETFESCLWCAQSRSFVISSEGVRETLSNLSLTADESVNGDKVKKTLQEEKKIYKHDRGSGGLLNDAISRVELARARVKEIDDAMTRTAHLREEAEAEEAKKKSAEERRARADAARRAAASRTLIERFDELARAKAELSQIEGQRDALAECYPISASNPDRETLFKLRNLRSALMRRREDLNTAKLAMPQRSAIDMKAVELAESISASETEDTFIGRIRSAISGAESRKKSALALFLIGGASVAVAVIMALIGQILLAVLGAAVAVGGVVVGLMGSRAAAQKAAETERELGELGMRSDTYEKVVRDAFAQLRVYAESERINQSAQVQIKTAEQLLADAESECREFFSHFGIEYSDSAAEELAGKIGEYLAAKEQIEKNLDVKLGIVNQQSAALSKYDEAAIRAELPKSADFVGDADAEYEAADADYKVAEARLSNLRVEIAKCGFDADARADAVAVLEAAKAERDDYKDKLDVLMLAHDAVDRAYENMRRNFAPKIREGASEYLADISKGRYKSVMLSENMDVSVDAAGESVAVGTLSKGTSDAVYVALRMSLIGNIFEGNVPLFMDESLSSLDNTRAEGVLRMIEKFVGNGSQCLLFTCHSREQTLCDNLGINYNLIKL